MSSFMNPDVESVIWTGDNFHMVKMVFPEGVSEIQGTKNLRVDTKSGVQTASIGDEIAMDVHRSLFVRMG